MNHFSNKWNNRPKFSESFIQFFVFFVFFFYKHLSNENLYLLRNSAQLWSWITLQMIKKKKNVIKKIILIEIGPCNLNYDLYKKICNRSFNLSLLLFLAKLKLCYLNAVNEEIKDHFISMAFKCLAVERC